MRLFEFNSVIPLIIAIFIISFGFRLIGITQQFEVWDEVTVVRNGEIYLSNIAKGDFSESTWALNKEHPPLSKYVYGASRLISLNVNYFSDVLDQDYSLGKRYTFQRILSALIGSLTVVLVFLFAKKFYNTQIAILAAFILCFTPYFVGHTKVATQEGLVAFLTALATYFFFLGLKSKNLLSNQFILSGVALGFAISTKYNALLFLPLYAVLTLVVFWKEFTKSPFKILKNKIIFIPIISFGILIVIWPWLWHEPFAQFLASTSSRVGVSRYYEPANEYFLGMYPHNNPWYYFFVYFIATTPLVLLFGSLVFVVKTLTREKNYDLWFLLYFLTPFLAFLSPLKIDGIRYIFTIYPALAIVSSVGITFFVKNTKSLLKNYSMIYERGMYIFIIFSMLFISVLYHPYYLDYYNLIFGGPKEIYGGKLFDYGYWGEGLRKGFEFLNDEPGENKKVYYKILPVHVIPELEPSVVNVSPIEEADYVIINPTGMWLNETNYLNYDFPENFRVVFEEKVYDGTPIVTIYKRISPYTEFTKDIDEEKQ